MNFRKHGELKGQHALFSPSQNSWLRYTPEQVEQRFENQYRSVLGTEIHEYVAAQIVLAHKVASIKSVKEGVESAIYNKYRVGEDAKTAEYGRTLIDNVGKLPKEVFETAKYYINDGISFHMSVEQPLYYSIYIFGTADTISYREDTHHLQIHDYKSGERAAHMDQLMVYAGLFCLEYEIKPRDIKTELRIYQSGEIVTHEPDTDELQAIISTIVETNRILERIDSKYKEMRGYM
jgi:hypothetical protein